MTTRAWRTATAAVVAALAGWAAASVACSAPNPDALWQAVQGCIHNPAKNPSCKYVGRNASGAPEYVVIKDNSGAYQFLVLPAKKTTGIEAPDLIAAGAPNYWASAWAARKYMDALFGKPIPRDEVSLAVNSTAARSQNQLHIHVDCIQKTVRDALQANDAQIPDHWTSYQLTLSGHAYFVRKLASADLAGDNPFPLVAGRNQMTDGDMAIQTIVVVGAGSDSKTPGAAPAGFYLLNDAVDVQAGDAGWGEELMDHGCGLLSASGPVSAH